jgi:hypothetical protein
MGLCHLQQSFLPKVNCFQRILDMWFAALKCAAVSIKRAFRFLERSKSLLPALFFVLPVRRVRFLLLLPAAVMLLSAGVSQAQNYADYKVVGTGADAGVSFELLATQPPTTPGLTPTFGLIHCMVPSGEDCSAGAAQAGYSASGGVLRLTTSGINGQTRTWNFPQFLHAGVYVGHSGAGLASGYVIVSGADATAGQPQSNAINSTFQFPLEVTVNDSVPSYQSGVTVTFTTPGSGPSAVLPGSGQAITDTTGRARLTPMANGIPGAYQITANAIVGGNTFQTSFVMANVNTANATGACQVTTANDDFSVGSLRYQVAACGEGGTITFASGINTVNLAVTQDIPLTQDLTIDGGGGVAINANGQSRIFFITGGSITLKNLTLEDGSAMGGAGGGGSFGGGGGAAGMGGAIFVNAGSLVINNVTFNSNQATGGSGGPTISDLSVSAAGGGGGVGGLGGSSAPPTNGNGGGGGDFGSSGGGGGGSVQNGSGDGAGGGNTGAGAFGAGGSGASNIGGPGGFGGGGGNGNGGEGAGGAFAGNGGAGLGGALFMRNGALSLSNATFISNTAIGGGSPSGGGNGQGKGGAIYISSTASAVSAPALPTFNANSAASAGTGTACNTVAGSNALDTIDICGILTGPATHFSVTAPPSVTSSIGYSVTLTALDANNNVVTGYTGTVHLSSTDPGFVNSTGDSTLTNGVGTFNVVMKQAGMQTITATDTVNTSITGTSSNILASPGVPALVMVSAPATTNGGATFPVTVTMTDLFGNLATSYSGTLHFTSSDAAAMLPANSVLTGGTGVFNATLETQGTQTVTATDTVTTSLSGISNGITVSIPGLVVTTTADSGTGSLRAALATAAADGSANITFDPTMFATPQTITLSSTLNIPSNTTITGPTSGSGATLKNLVTVDGGGASSNFSMFTVNGGVTGAAIHNLVIANGHVDSQGGGVMNSGSLTITSCTFSNNYAGGYITASGNGGGAIYANSGTLAVSDSTFVGNTSAPGGAIGANSGIVTINQSTFSGNSALDAKVGGAIFINTSVTMTIAGSTFSGNSATGGEGGAIFNYGTLTATNTIMAGNTGGDCGAGGSNTCPTNDANGNVIGVSGISLAPLGNYGGPTQTMIPLPGSPAICAGSVAAIPGGVTADQRGEPRTTVYGVTTCNDAGAVQTNYSLSFSQQPTGGSANATITPSPAVQLYDNGAPIALGGAAISLSSGTLNGTTPQQTNTNGQAIFGDLSIGTQQTNDSLTALVALTAAGSPAPETASVTSASFDITTLTPAITFTVQNHTYGDAAFPVAATSNSSGTITYSVVLGPATVSGNIVTLTGAGPVTLEASQVASGPYAAATQQTTFNVVKATPSITWVPASRISYGTSLSALLNASASYNSTSVPGTFSYTAQAAGSSVVPVTAVTVLAPGSYTLAASFTPTVTVNYEPANTSVQLLVAQATLTIAANNASKVYGAPNPAFTGTVTGAVNNDGFTETFSTAATTASNAGTYAIVPSVTGSDLSDYMVTATNGTLSVMKAATATTLGASANSIASGQSLTLTAQVMDGSAGSTGTPTGTVSFYDGTTLLGASTLTNSTASYTTATLAPGATHTLTATYVGDVNFTASTSNTGTIVVGAPPDFIFNGATPAAYTAAPGAVATYSFSLSPLPGGYPGPVGFSVTGLPASATATFTPSSVAANAGPTTVGMTVQTPSAVSRNSSDLLGRGIVLALLLLPFSTSRGMRKKLKGSKPLTVLLLVGITATMTGCGSGNSFLLQKTQSYTLTVTATSGTTQHNQTVTLIVQ